MAAAVPRPLAEVARAQAWVLKPAPAKAAPAQKVATAPETELASALDLALLPAAARAQATDAARADSLASPLKTWRRLSPRTKKCRSFPMSCCGDMTGGR